MIEFKIMHCPERSQIANYQHLGNELVFGAEEGDMLIDDLEISERQARIFLSDNGFLIENLEPSVDIKLNGRSVSGPSPIKTRDSITMGKTTIQMSLLDPAPAKAPKPFTHPQAEARFIPGSKEEAILAVLQHLSTAGAQAAPPPLPTVAPPPIPGMPSPPPKKGS